VVREGFFEEVALEQRCGGVERVSHVGNSIVGRGKSKCEGLS
jgi:hypothetical protein